MATISLTRALATRKLLDSKIASAISTSIFADVALGDQKTPVQKNFPTSEAFIDRCTSDVQSVNDLISRRTDINNAILTANATTNVIIGKATMTIAAAIDMKKVIEFKRAALGNWSGQLRAAIQKMHQMDANLTDTVEQRVQTILGKGENKNSDAFKEQLSTIRTNLEKTAKPFLIGFKDGELMLKNMSTEIEEFITNIDFALSEINARTEIEIKD